MSENILHIDDDWKRQAQEEKRRLAEEEARKKAEATTAPAGVRPPVSAAMGAGFAAGSGSGGAAGVSGGSANPAGAAVADTAAARSESATGRRRAAVPQASFAGLVQTLLTQALFYLGDLGTRSGQTVVDLDLAKLQIDLLGVLEEKTRGNLSDAEKQLLDNALYEVRMRFVAVAREYATV